MNIIVVNNSGRLLIKRVIGLPGETIQIVNNDILINGEKIQDVVHCPTSSGIAANEITLQDTEYFILGDNRENSADSRDEEIGVIQEKNIVGKIVFSVLPFKKIN